MCSVHRRSQTQSTLCAANSQSSTLREGNEAWQSIYLRCLFNCLLKTAENTAKAGGLVFHHTHILYPSLSPVPSGSFLFFVCVYIHVFCAPMCPHRVYLVTLLTCILSHKPNLRKASKKELLIIQQRSVM